VERFEEARGILASAGDAAAMPLADHNIGALWLRADRLSDAETAFERGLAAAREVGDRRLEVILLDDLSHLFSQKEAVCARIRGLSGIVRQPWPSGPEQCCAAP
jgi:hypothetical protein